MKSERPGAGALGPRVAICAVLALAFTLLMVNYSRLYGRLIFLPVVDDAAYMNDALARLKALYSAGFRGLVRGFLETTPPHSPFSSGLGMASFALLGRHDWAPYVGNVVIVFALVAFTALLMSGTRLWELLLACVFVLATPLAANAVSEFRPDVACGIVTAAGLVLLLGRPFARSSLRYRVSVGACLGAALLIKPTIAPLTIALFAAALALALLCDLGPKEDRPGLAGLLAACVPVGAVAVLMAIPYYAVAWKYVADYIQRHMLGSPSGLWMFRGSAMAHARYFLDGPGGAYMLGDYLWPVLGLAVLGAALALRRHEVSAGRLASFGAVIAIAYLIPTLSWAKNLYIAVVFHALLLFSAVLGLRLLVTRTEAEPAREGRAALILGRATLVAAVVLGLCLARFPAAWGVRGSEAVQSRNHLIQGIYAAVKERTGSRKSSTFLTTFGTVNKGTLQFLALRDGAELTFSDEVLSDRLPDYARSFEGADFVVASDSDSREAPDWLPSTKVQGQTLALIRSNADFGLIASFPAASGKPYYLFARRAKFSGWKALSGVGEVEGPYPNQGLPLVRWGMAPATVLAVDGMQGGRLRLVMRCYTYIPNQEVAVRLDGRRAAVLVLPVAGKAYRFETPLDVSSGPHTIELVYKEWSRDQPSRPLAVVFAELRLER